MEPSKDETEIYHACANSSLLQIFKLFFNKNYFGLNGAIILLAICNSTCEFVKFVILCLGEDFALYEKQHLSIFLREAVKRSEPEIVNFLLKYEAFDFRELIENVNDVTRLILCDCVSNTKYKLEDDIEIRMGVIRLLFEINPQLLEEKNDCGRTPLLCEYVHVDLLKELIRLGADVTSQDMMGDTVLHLSKNQTRRLNAHEYHSLLLTVPNLKLTQILNSAANDKEVPFIRLLKFIDPSEETIDILLQGQDNLIQKAFTVAIVHGSNLQTLENLIKRGVDMFWRGNEGQSYLHVASLYGNIDAVQVLIQDKGFDVNIKDRDLQTPLDYAILGKEKNRFETAIALHNFGGRAGDQINSELQHILNQAIKDGNAETVRIIQEILKSGNGSLNKSEIPITPEVGQAYGISGENFKLLVKDFVKNKKTSYRDSNGWSLLHLAASRGDELAVKELVEHGADLDAIDLYGNSPINCACFCLDLITGFRIIRFLIDNGATVIVDSQSSTLFVDILVMRCIKRDFGPPISPSLFHEITEYLAEVDLLDVLITPHTSNMFTSLHLACQLLELEEKTITLLRQKDISFNKLDNGGCNVLTYAIFGKRSKEFINLLVSKGKAEWRQMDKNGNSFLHCAAEEGHLDALDLFLDLGLDVNQINRFWQTPLHRVVGYGKRNILETVRKLVEKGIDFSKKDRDGHIALDFAMLRRQDDKLDGEIAIKLVNLLKIGISDIESKTPNALMVLVNSVKVSGEIQELILHKAVADTRNFNDCWNVIKSLIPTVDNVYAEDQEGYTFLHKLICLHSHVPSQFHKISKYLLDSGHKKLFEIPGGKDVSHYALHLAVQHVELKLETLQLFKSHGINFNSVNSKGNSILAYAIYGERSPKFVAHLVNEFGVSWRRLNKSKQNLLHIAAGYGNEDAFRFYFKLGLDINSRDLIGWTPLHAAITYNSDNILKMLQLLLCNGAEINAKNNEGRTPLHCTGFIKQQLNILPVVQFLIENGADAFAMDGEKLTFLHLLTLVLEDDSCPITPLIFHQLVQYLLERDYYKLFHTPGWEFGRTPVHNATWHLEVQNDTLRLLYRNKNDINIQDSGGHSSLSYAIVGKRSRKLCQALVNLGADISENVKDEYGKDLLHISSSDGIPEVVELFVELGFNVNGRDNSGRTPLHWAASRGDGDPAIEIIKCLIKNGADPNAFDCKENSPLHVAINRSTHSLPVINCLISNGAQVDSLNFYNTNYIHLAAYMGRVEVLKLFLDMSILDVNAVDVDGNTPLQCAVLQKESDYVLEKVRILVEHGVNVSIKNKNGQTALDCVDRRVDLFDDIKHKIKELLTWS